MKKSVLVILLSLLTFAGPAQVRLPFKNPFGESKTQLRQKNAKLQSTIDSLRALLDSVEVARREEAESAINILETEVQRPEPPKYDPALMDSLLGLWYTTRFEDGSENPVEEYDMEVEHFTSDVSDSVMMQRLADMNAYFTLPFNQNVKNYMILYSEKMRKRMGYIMGLSKYYFPIFEATFAKYGLPHELKYMAIVESMLNPTATSRAGARGIWQFMYNTGRTYGLTIDSFVDERLDVEKSADAAARYLRDAYRIFGDWSLAISSYNCGAGNISKAIRRASGQRDFWSIYPYLPRETSRYMPAFVGAMYAMTYYKEYGIEPQEVGMPAAVDTFMIRKRLHFKQLNEVVGIPVEDLERLNPQYVHDIVPGTEAAPCVLNLPYNWSPAFDAADKDSLYNHKAVELFSAEATKAAVAGGPSNRIVYKVKSGDYLGKIASRYHVSVSQLKSWNHLRSDKLRVGQVLYIYK